MLSQVFSSIQKHKTQLDVLFFSCCCASCKLEIEYMNFFHHFLCLIIVIQNRFSLQLVSSMYIVYTKLSRTIEKRAINIVYIVCFYIPGKINIHIIIPSKWIKHTFQDYPFVHLFTTHELNLYVVHTSKLLLCFIQTHLIEQYMNQVSIVTSLLSFNNDTT